MQGRVDERGRIVIPKRIRRAKGLTPGTPVDIEETGHGIRVHPRHASRQALRELAGIINEATRRRGAEPIDPIEIKRIWEPPYGREPARGRRKGSRH